MWFNQNQPHFWLQYTRNLIHNFKTASSKVYQTKKIIVNSRNITLVFNNCYCYMIQYNQNIRLVYNFFKIYCVENFLYAYSVGTHYTFRLSYSVHFSMRCFCENWQLYPSKYANSIHIFLART